MQMSIDVRWKQRFESFKKAVMQLTEFIEKDELNKYEVQGLIQCFEYTFELAWKTMKDYLGQEGFDVNSPRSAIQTAFQMQLIADGQTWIDALDKRDLMAHTYDEKRTMEVERLIREKYYKIIKELYFKLGDLL
jgi:nucleotidyltransferase substrate binding protein (TIGR01987 family)